MTIVVGPKYLHWNLALDPRLVPCRIVAVDTRDSPKYEEKIMNTTQ